MKLDLNKWNPFKFLRKTPEQKRAEPASSAPLAAGGLPVAWTDPWELPMVDPFRLMQHVLRDPLGGIGRLDQWFGDYSASVFQPRIDVVDDGEVLRVSAELPGMDRDDVDVSIEEDALILRGEKKLESESEEKGCYRVERAFGSFQRVIPLPEGTDRDRAEARFEKGVLTIRIPKSAGEKSVGRRLAIK